jgi:signal transduction histidine kinase
MDFGATSTIAAALQAHVRVLVHAETQDGSFELGVANAGEPIPEASMETLFEPFFAESPREQARTRVGTIHRFPDREGA